jgi:hypothetical protein
LRAIFLSYRRDDAEGEAGRLFDDLTAEFGTDKVFMDVAGIELGRDFRKVIDENVSSCGVLLAMIGKSWIDAKDEDGRRRLDAPLDFVRLETASALKRDIPVIPVLVQRGRMPRPEELPEDVKDLAFRNAVELTHARWDSDVQLLIKALRPHVGNPPKEGGSTKPELMPDLAIGKRMALAPDKVQIPGTSQIARPKPAIRSRRSVVVFVVIALVLAAGGLGTYEYKKTAEAKVRAAAEALAKQSAEQEAARKAAAERASAEQEAARKAAAERASTPQPAARQAVSGIDTARKKSSKATPADTPGSNHESVGVSSADIKREPAAVPAQTNAGTAGSNTVVPNSQLSLPPTTKAAEIEPIHGPSNSVADPTPSVPSPSSANVGDRGRAWLDAQKDPPAMNVTGSWNSEEWGDLRLIQTQGGRDVSGDAPGYELTGVVSGKRLLLLFHNAKGKVDYCATLDTAADNKLSGGYSDRVTRLRFGHGLCQEKSRPMRMIKK